MAKDAKKNITRAVAHSKAEPVKTETKNVAPVEKLSDMQVLMQAIVNRLKEAGVPVNADNGARIVLKKEYYDCERMFPNVTGNAKFNFTIKMDAVTEKGVNTLADMARLKRDVTLALQSQPLPVRDLNVIMGGLTSPYHDEVVVGARVSKSTATMYAIRRKGVI